MSSAQKRSECYIWDPDPTAEAGASESEMASTQLIDLNRSCIVASAYDLNPGNGLKADLQTTCLGPCDAMLEASFNFPDCRTSVPANRRR